MSALTGNTPKTTYKDLLQVSNSNSGVDATLRDISDGEGTASALQISSAGVNSTGTLQKGGTDVEIVSNKSTDTALGSSDILYPSQNAVKTYVDSSVTGLLDDRGNYDPTVTSQYPASGGSGAAGAILKGDMWYISAAGTMGSEAVVVGSSVRALVDSPGQTASNWDILNVGLGYTSENVANKSTSTSLGTSDTLYPSQNAVKSYVDTAVSPGVLSEVTEVDSANDSIRMTDDSASADKKIIIDEFFGKINPIFNGRFQYDQAYEKAEQTSVTASRYVCDQWAFYLSASGTWKHQVLKRTDSTDNTPDVNTQFAMGLECTANDATVNAGDYAYLAAMVEVGETKPFLGNPATICFDVYSTKTGTQYALLRNGKIGGTTDQSVLLAYTVDSSETWESKQILIPQFPTSGDWDNADDVGLEIGFPLVSGSTYHTTAESWQGGNYLGVSGMSNHADTIGNKFWVANVRMVPGVVHMPHMPYFAGDVFARCCRYMQKSYSNGTAVGANSSIALCQVSNPVTSSNQLPGTRFAFPMRSAPTVTIYSKNGTSGKVSDTSYNDYAATGCGAADIGTGGFRYIYGSSFASSAMYCWHYWATATL